MFVYSNDYADAVRKILAEPGDSSVAVAFWGQESELLFDDLRGRTRVICNLRSGATNPEPIALLRKRSNVQLKQHDRLHAKVVLNERAALVGSANLSSNGLSLEADEVRGWEEAGVLTENPEEVQAAQRWFDALWSKSRVVTDVDLEEAKVKWKERRAQRVVAGQGKKPSQGFSLEAMSKAELADRPVVVAIYRDRADVEAAYRAESKKQTGMPMKKSDPSPPMYVDWPELPWDVQIIDVYYGERSAVKCFGVFSRVHDMECKHRKKTRHLAICQEDADLLGQKFLGGDAKRFAAVLKPHIQSIWDSEKAIGDERGRVVPLEEVARICREN